MAVVRGVPTALTQPPKPSGGAYVGQHGIVVLAPDAVVALRSRAPRHQQTRRPGATTAVRLLADIELIALEGADVEGYAQALEGPNSGCGGLPRLGRPPRRVYLVASGGKGGDCVTAALVNGRSVR